MEAAPTLVERYYAWADVQEQKLFEYFDPEGGHKLHPGQNLPMANLGTVLAAIIAYYTFIFVGTFVMKRFNIPAINTAPIQFIYNPIQVMLCSYACVEALLVAYKNGFSVTPCNRFDHTKPVVNHVLYVFFLSKYFDFFDTVFIVLGKKWRQLSFLHVYHHASILFIIYMNYRAVFDGDIYYIIVWNSLVHVVMYMYYFISAHTRHIWWKRYLTLLQLVQFGCMNLQGYQLLRNNCQHIPWRVVVLYVVYIQSLFWMFVNFFVRSYCNKGKESARVKGLQQPEKELTPPRGKAKFA